MVRPTKFEISERTDGATRVLSLAGELDIGNVSLVTERIGDEPGKDASDLILDLSELTFMDSSGLRLLIALDQRSSREGWGLSLVRSKHEPANTVLRLTGADTALPFEDAPRP